MERSFGVFLNRREQECLDLYLMRTLNRVGMRYQELFTEKYALLLENP